MLNYTLTLSLDALAHNKNYYVHFSGNNLNAKATPGTVTIGAVNYTLSNNKSSDWTNGLVWIKVNDTSVKTIVVNNDAATLVEENDKVYMVVTGTYQAYTETELREELLKKPCDVEQDGNSSNKVDLKEKLTITVSEGTFEAKIEITDVTAGNYWVHFGGNDCCNTGNGGTVTVGTKTYTFIHDNRGEWTAHLLSVTDSAATPETPAE